MVFSPQKTFMSHLWHFSLNHAYQTYPIYEKAWDWHFETKLIDAKYLSILASEKCVQLLFPLKQIDTWNKNATFN